jgi:energy-coupling factor transporter ATP-binding protein EcfA2
MQNYSTVNFLQRHRVYAVSFFILGLAVFLIGGGYSFRFKNPLYKPLIGSVALSLMINARLFCAKSDQIVAGSDNRAIATLSPGVEMETGSINPVPFDVRGFLDEVTGVAILGNSGSGKTTLAQYIAGAMGQTQVIILDPHADPEDEHYPWGNLFVIRDKDEILDQLQILLDLLDARDKTPLVIIADEYPAIRAYANKQKSKVADEFILRYGSEARKFKKLPIFISQSGNVKALGLEGQGDFLENFALIRLQKIAVKFLKNSPDRLLHQKVKSTPYSMLLGEDDMVIHPTHGQYKKVEKSLPPKNLKPLVSLPLTIPLAVKNSVTVARGQGVEAKPHHTPPDFLERCYSMEPTRPHHTTHTVDSCPHCGSTNTTPHGKTRAGTTRKMCQDCKKTFSI